jgi:signal peptidase II
VGDRKLGTAARYALEAFAVAVLVALDQATKALAVAFLQGSPPIRFPGDVVVLGYAENRGAFLSLASELGGPLWWLVLVAIPIAMTIGVVAWVVARKRGDGFYEALAVLFVAGGAGNLVDRIGRGSVVDFLNFGIGASFRTGIMNVADLYIAACVVMVVVKTISESRAERKAARIGRDAPTDLGTEGSGDRESREGNGDDGGTG